MTDAIAGHGATIGVELDPVGAQGTFTTIAELQDISVPGMSRGETEVTAHDKVLDDWVLSTRALMTALESTVNFVFDGATHDHLTGLRKLELDGTRFGVQVRGPNGSANTHEFIRSGEVQNFGPITYPVREGVVTAPFAIRLSGAMKIDGVTFGP